MTLVTLPPPVNPVVVAVVLVVVVVVDVTSTPSFTTSLSYKGGYMAGDNARFKDSFTSAEVTRKPRGSTFDISATSIARSVLKQSYHFNSGCQLPSLSENPA